MKLIQAIHSMDLIVFDRLCSINLRFHLTHSARMVSRLADGPLYVIVGLVFIALKSWMWVHIMLVAFALERAMYFILKNSFKRNRPAQAITNFNSLITPSDTFSFPSGHTSAAFLMATILFFASGGLLFWLYCLAVCVGLSRVLLGVHFITDTIAGAALGSIIGFLTIKFFTL